jgi:hypothetical protein
LTRRPVRLPTEGRPFLDLFSLGRPGPSGRFTPDQIDYIRRTVSRAPEVMVKVTGGGTKTGAVAAHFAYISRKGELAIETDEGFRVAGRDAQKLLLNDWHLELLRGQYRGPRDGRATARKAKLVHNIVLSMPSPTPPEKVLTAARKFAREKFALQYRYVMVLHTDQPNPHVHMVVKAESEQGQRLRIDKEKLRQWREDFARMMREQGIAANATSRSIRGKTRGKNKDAIFRAQQRGASTAVRNRVTDVVKEARSTGAIRDPARNRLVETRKTVIDNWNITADLLDAQGETILSNEARYFAQHLPPVLTDKERLAVQFLQHMRARGATAPTAEKNIRDHDRTR